MTPHDDKQRSLPYVTYVSNVSAFADCQVLRTILKVFAPIAPHLAEELYEAANISTKPSVLVDHWQPTVGIFNMKYANDQPNWLDTAIKSDMEIILSVRGQILALIEEARNAK